MPTFSRKAVQVRQGNLTLYLTYVTPNDLFADNFYTVDTLESNTQDGFQRILNEQRAARLSRHLTEAYVPGYAHLPTTVFLATSQSVSFDDLTNTIEFDKSLVCPFSVVDGQHRIEGLRRAIAKEEELRDFQLPVTIATDLDRTHQMYHFFIVNTTQVPVEPSMRQQITRRFTDMQGVAALPYMPYWLEHDIGLGRDARALRIVEELNRNVSSPLAERIQMANDPDSHNKIKQASIVNLFKTEVLTASNPIAVQETDPDRQSRIMINYFQAVDGILVDGRDRNQTVVYKNNGLYFILGISKWIFNAIYSTTRDFTVTSLEDCLRSGLFGLDDRFRAVSDPDWWLPGPLGASGLNRSAANQYINAFQQALARSQNSGIRL